MNDQSPRAPINTKRKGDVDEISEFVEREGQRRFVDNETLLPSDMQGNAREVLEAAGVKFGQPVESDPMFQYVELPPGWKKKARPDQPLWSDLVDDKDRRRAAIFYKVQDRSAHLNTTLRFGIGLDYKRLEIEGVAVGQVVDGDNTIHTTEPIKIEEKEKRYESIRQAMNLAEAWLTENYPYWKSACFYWD